MIPPSQVDLPEELWPPARTAVSNWCARANSTERLTSAAPEQRAMSAGCLSNAPFQTLRAASYPASSGSSSCPRKPAAKSATSVPRSVVAPRSGCAQADPMSLQQMPRIARRARRSGAMRTRRARPAQTCVFAWLIPPLLRRFNDAGWSASKTIAASPSDTIDARCLCGAMHSLAPAVEPNRVSSFLTA